METNEITIKERRFIEELPKILNDNLQSIQGDLLIESLNVMRNAIINHIHGTPNYQAIKTL